MMNDKYKKARFRILVIDDNASIHDDFRKILLKEPSDQKDLEHMESELFGSKVAPTFKNFFEIL